MAYIKPEVVAKSENKQSYVAGCPVNKPSYTTSMGRDTGCVRCERSGR